MLFYLFAPFLLFTIITIVNFFYYVFSERLLSHPIIWRVTEVWTMLLAPLVFVGYFDYGMKNECCGTTAVFASGDRNSIYTLMLLSIVFYFYAAYRKKIGSPVAELLVNAMLVLGMILNLLVGIHIYPEWRLIGMGGNGSILLLQILLLKKNEQLLHNKLTAQTTASGPARLLAILQSKSWIKFPVLSLIALPIVLLVNLALYLFGQKPDALIRAFTDTYKHGFSQMDYLCDNVHCGGHFLCSVAAKGHKKLVQPVRLGERNGKPIICNRQLLVANAFEELVQDHFPLLHRHIRRQYNRVGNIVHRYYSVFNKKIVADMVYVLMKPLEWTFLFILYSFDTHPESRIAKQYLSRTDRNKIEEIENYRKD